MKLLTSIIGAGVAAAAVAGGAFAVPAFASPHAASSHAASHTMSFTAVTKASVGFSDASAGVQQTDVNQAGQTIGFDETYGTATSASTVDNDFTLDTRGGLLYGAYTLNVMTGKVTDGRVTGGTGAFRHATGTLAAKAVSSHKYTITVTYRT
ncbi:MAG TPA: hypothetical protein VN847_27255 [Streptosporangiaceae bacterium]|nr:hypothetical protein [Streptosporangiaceae bacterium]